MKPRVAAYTAAVPVAALAIAGALWVHHSGGMEAPSAQATMAAMAGEQGPVSAISAIKSAEKVERPARQAAAAGATLTPLAADDPRWRRTAPAQDALVKSLSEQDRLMENEAGSIETAFAAPDHADQASGDAAILMIDEETPAGNAQTVISRTMSISGEPVAPDAQTTTAIADTAPELAPGVQVAETDVEIVALEVAVAEAQADQPNAAFVSDGIEMVPGRIKSYVNLRAGPSNDAEVLTIVPAGTRIEAQPIAQCVHFCQVIVDGQRGFIGKTFIAFEDRRETAEAD